MILSLHTINGFHRGKKKNNNKVEMIEVEETCKWKNILCGLIELGDEKNHFYLFGYNKKWKKEIRSETNNEISRIYSHVNAQQPFSLVFMYASCLFVCHLLSQFGLFFMVIAQLKSLS